MKGYIQINVIYANKLYHRPANQYESDFSITNKAHDTNLMLLVFLEVWYLIVSIPDLCTLTYFKEVGNLSFITFGHIK